MKPKKEAKTKVSKTTNSAPEASTEISSKEDLKTFLQSVRDKLADSSASAIYALGAVNHVMSLPDIYSLLDNENKEIARDIWLRIKQSGMQVKNPPLLFKQEEAESLSATA